MSCTIIALCFVSCCVEAKDIAPASNTHTHTQSLLNQEGLSQVQAVANMTEQALQQGEYAKATQLWGEAEDTIETVCSTHHTMKWQFLMDESV